MPEKKFDSNKKKKKKAEEPMGKTKPSLDWHNSAASVCVCIER